MKQGDIFGLLSLLAVACVIFNNSQMQVMTPALVLDFIPSSQPGNGTARAPFRIQNTSERLLHYPPTLGANPELTEREPTATPIIRPAVKTTGGSVAHPPPATTPQQLPHPTTKYMNSESRISPQSNTIAYAITITRCEDLDSPVLPGATVLAELILDHSARRSNSSKYDAKLYAFLGETNVTETCELLLQRIGYTTLRKPVPMNISAINHDFYHFAMEKNGCCGAAEFLKLWSYTLMEHPAVVHLDLDVLVLKPLDDMLDVLLLPPGERREQYRRLHVTRDKEQFENATMEAFITRDYSQVVQQKRFKPYKLIPVQGGFFVVKPNMTVFRELCDTVQNLEHTYSKWGAWGNMMYPGFWGMPQIQGLLAYYYGFLAPGTALELHNCYYNTILGVATHQDKCVNGLNECEDCRKTPLDQIVLAHPVFCYKPWQCIKWRDVDFLPRAQPCRHFMNIWTSTRRKIELRWKQDLVWELSPQNGNSLPEIYNGYCFTNKSFVPMGFQPNSLLPRIGQDARGTNSTRVRS